MKFSLDNDLKKKALQRVINELESELIVRLTILGIDLNEFDPDSFVPSESSTAEKDIFQIISKINKHQLEIDELN